MKKLLLLILIVLIAAIPFYLLNKKGFISFPTKKKFFLKHEDTPGVNNIKDEANGKYLSKIATKGKGSANFIQKGIKLDFELKYLNPSSAVPDFFVVTIYNKGKRDIKNLWIKLSVKEKTKGETKEISKTYQLILYDHFKPGEKRKCILNWKEFPPNWEKTSFKIIITKIEYND